MPVLTSLSHPTSISALMEASVAESRYRSASFSRAASQRAEGERGGDGGDKHGRLFACTSLSGGQHESNDRGRLCDAKTVTVRIRPGNERMMASFVRSAATCCTRMLLVGCFDGLLQSISPTRVIQTRFQVCASARLKFCVGYENAATYNDGRNTRHRIC